MRRQLTRFVHGVVICRGVPLWAPAFSNWLNNIRVPTEGRPYKLRHHRLVVLVVLLELVFIRHHYLKSTTGQDRLGSKSTSIARLVKFIHFSSATSQSTWAE